MRPGAERSGTGATTMPGCIMCVCCSRSRICRYDVSRSRVKKTQNTHTSRSGGHATYIIRKYCRNAKDYLSIKVTFSLVDACVCSYAHIIDSARLSAPSQSISSVCVFRYARAHAQSASSNSYVRVTQSLRNTFPVADKNI